MRVLAIDPGTTVSGAVIYDTITGVVHWVAREWENERILQRIIFPVDHWDVVVCEWFEHYGKHMNAGRDVFLAIRWVGRFEQACELRGVPFRTVTRRQAKLHLCGNSRAKDPNVRQAIVDRYGGDKAAKGRKAEPGPLYGVSKHAWAALAVAIAWSEDPERVL